MASTRRSRATRPSARAPSTSTRRRTRRDSSSRARRPRRSRASRVSAISIVIADEAYEDLVYEGEHVSIASLEGMFERTITCYTLSKSYAMTGWRVGYAAAAEPWMTGMQEVPALLDERRLDALAVGRGRGLLARPSDFYEGIRHEYRERRDLLVSGLNEFGLTCAPPAGRLLRLPRRLARRHGQPRRRRHPARTRAGRDRPRRRLRRARRGAPPLLLLDLARDDSGRPRLAPAKPLRGVMSDK